MKIMLVDNRLLARNGITSLLQALGHEAAAESGNGIEALDIIDEASPGWVLMAIRVPEMGGLEATRVIKARLPDIKMAILTVSDGENDLFEAIKSRAHGYLLKDLEGSEFLSGCCSRTTATGAGTELPARC